MSKKREPRLELPHANRDYSTLNVVELREEWSSIYQNLWHNDELTPQQRRAMKARVSKLAHHHLMRAA